MAVKKRFPYKAAFVACNGGCRATAECQYGCVGCELCVNVCKFEAIALNEYGVAEDVYKRQLHDNVGVHLDEAAVGVVCKAGIVGLLGESDDDLVVQAKVQDGVHHAGHGSACAGAEDVYKRQAHG